MNEQIASTVKIRENEIICCDARDGLPQLEEESIDCVISSPPYLSLRDYKIKPTIWDGNSNCDHQWDEYETKTEGYANEGKRWNHGYNRDTAPEAWSKEIVKGAFCSKCGAWLGSLGLEPSIELYIKHLCDIYDLVWKALKWTGTNWINLGDTYNGSGGAGGDYNEGGLKEGQPKYKQTIQALLPTKCLMMVPYRFAIEMINRRWILRNIIIWHKKNCRPDSARDRFTVDYESVFFFTKSNKNQYWINERTKQLVSKQPIGTKGIEGIDWEWIDCPICKEAGASKKTKIPLENSNSFGSPRARNHRYKEETCKRCKGTGKIKYNFWKGKNYYFDQNVVRENHEEPWRSTGKKESRGNKYNTNERGVLNNSMFSKGTREYNPLGRNRRCVWSISTQPNTEKHFATFPMTLVKPMILAGSPIETCMKCGKPREKIIETKFIPRDQLPKDHRDYRPHARNLGEVKGHDKEFNVHPTGCELTHGSGRNLTKTVGWSDCECNEGFRPGLVLDPFAGTGTTLLESWKQGRNFIGFEISSEYCAIAKKRLKTTKNKRVTDF